MSDEDTKTEENVETVKAVDAPEPRAIVLDDVSYLVQDLPGPIQQLVQTYDVWVVDKANAQKTFGQLDSACRFLARTISDNVDAWVAASKAKTEAQAKTDVSDEPEVETAGAKLDIPADESANDVE